MQTGGAHGPPCYFNHTPNLYTMIPITDDQTISITKVANGWIVRMPEKDEGPFKGMDMMLEKVKKFTRGLNPEEDDILAKIMNEAEEEDNAKPKSGTYIFTEFEEVLKHLSENVNF